MLFFYALCMLAGHLLVLLAPARLSPELFFLLPDLLLVLVAVALRERRFQKIMAAASIFLLGLVNAGLAVETALSQRLEANLRGEKIWVQGTIASVPRWREESVSFVLKGAKASYRPELELPPRIAVSWFRSAHRPASGELWRLPLTLRAPRAAMNPGGRDADGWYFREKIGARASVTGAGAQRLQGPSGSYGLLRLRERLAHAIRVGLNGHAMTGIVIGLAVGIRHDIQSAQWRLLSATGTGHLVAISGLHVGMISGLAYFCTRWLWSLSPFLSARVAPVDAARPLALCVGFFYTLLAGFALPARRALIMLALWFAAAAMRRPAAGLQVLSLGLISNLLIDPLSVLGAGFWLSFGAVATLVLMVHQRSRPRWRALITVQLKVFAGVAPVTLAAFGQVSLASPLANLIMIPIFSLVLIPLVLLTSLVLLLNPWLGSFMLQACVTLLDLLWPVLAQIGNLHWLSFGGRGLDGVVPALLLAGFLLLLPSWPGKPFLVIVLALALLLARGQSLPARALAVTVLDVGHGLSVVLHTRRHTLVYDLGAGRGEASAYTRVLVPYLREVIARPPDTLIVSHDDRSHSGDVKAFVSDFPGAAVLTGAPAAISAQLGHRRVTPCLPGQSWNWDGVHFEILHPGREIIWEDDDSSCVLHVSTAAGSLLISGDLSARGERRLLERRPGLKADVVIGLAHGSGRASSPELVKALNAVVAVVSTRAGNPWKLPSETVKERWRLQGTSLVDTGEVGAVSLWLESGWHYGWQRQGRIWHGP